MFYVSNPWECLMFKILGTALCSKSLGVPYGQNPWECLMFEILGSAFEILGSTKLTFPLILTNVTRSVDLIVIHRDRKQLQIS